MDIITFGAVMAKVSQSQQNAGSVEDEIESVGSVDGNYVYTATVTNGVATYNWEELSTWQGGSY